MDGRELLAAIKSISGANRRELIEALNDIEALGGFGKARVFGAERADDAADGYLRVPTRRELEVGRPHSASGGDTRRMFEDFGVRAPQSRHTDASEALGDLLEGVSERVGRLEKNMRGQLALIAAIAEAAGRSDIAKAVNSLLASAKAEEKRERRARSGDDNQDEWADADEDDDEREETAEKAGTAFAELKGLMGTVPTMGVADLFRTTFGQGPVAKASAVDQIVAALNGDELLSEGQRLAALEATNALRAVASGAIHPAVAKARIAALPSAAAKHFGSLAS